MPPKVSDWNLPAVLVPRRIAKVQFENLELERLLTRSRRRPPQKRVAEPL